MSFDGKAFGEEIVAAVRGYVDRRLFEMEGRLQAVETRGLKYAGIYQRAVDYERGTVVTHSGSAWVAVRDVATGDIPGTADGWQLMVKAGRDAKGSA
ncbi:hypothetical protein ATO13_17259 [Stappia sp. 22II-S9-Z10]|nr:hypothetical protein ATO13_17259 [Stappia sp. 22II-S9-Z10]